jgi:hypothetical protein
VTQVANDIADQAVLTDEADDPDFGFLPKSLTMQCRSLIESYHELHGYGCLPDILWKSRLGPFIESHREFRQLLKKASTTRSAKKSNEGFVRIATTLLSMEILASSFAGWSAIYPQAGSRAQTILKRHARSPQTPLMEFYLYPPKYINSAAIATLIPPRSRLPGDVEPSRPATPQRAGEKMALDYVGGITAAAPGLNA